jgi:hypothetical protein
MRVAFERWVTDPVDRDLGHVIHESLGQLSIVTAAG